MERLAGGFAVYHHAPRGGSLYARYMDWIIFLGWVAPLAVDDDQDPIRTCRAPASNGHVEDATF